MRAHAFYFLGASTRWQGLAWPLARDSKGSCRARPRQRGTCAGSPAVHHIAPQICSMCVDACTHTRMPRLDKHTWHLDTSSNPQTPVTRRPHPSPRCLYTPGLCVHAGSVISAHLHNMLHVCLSCAARGACVSLMRWHLHRFPLREIHGHTDT